MDDHVRQACDGKDMNDSEKNCGGIVDGAGSHRHIGRGIPIIVQCGSFCGNQLEVGHPTDQHRIPRAGLFYVVLNGIVVPFGWIGQWLLYLENVRGCAIGRKSLDMFSVRQHKRLAAGLTFTYSHTCVAVDQNGQNSKRAKPIYFWNIH
jgi:hypothetical protein